MSSLITRSDVGGRIEYINEKFMEITGFDNSDLKNSYNPIFEYIDKNLENEILLQLKKSNKWHGITKIKNKDGKFQYLETDMYYICDNDNIVKEFVTVSKDITSQYLKNETIKMSFYLDELTKVKNKIALFDDLSKNNQNNLAVFTIDNYSMIKSYYGSVVSDKLLVSLAKILSSKITSNFSLYRMEDDKFAILNSDYDLDSFSTLIKNLNVKILSTKITVDKHKFEILTHVGISNEENENIISTAELANIYSKRINKRVVIYDKSLNIEDSHNLIVDKLINKHKRA